VLGILTY